jgi:hypothetical protein
VFKSRFAESLDQLYPVTIELLIERELIVSEGDNLRLSANGILLADTVIENFVEPNIKKAGRSYSPAPKVFSSEAEEDSSKAVGVNK